MYKIISFIGPALIAFVAITIIFNIDEILIFIGLKEKPKKINNQAITCTCNAHQKHCVEINGSQPMVLCASCIRVAASEGNLVEIL